MAKNKKTPEQKAARAAYMIEYRRRAKEAKKMASDNTAAPDTTPNNTQSHVVRPGYDPASSWLLRAQKQGKLPEDLAAKLLNRTITREEIVEFYMKTANKYNLWADTQGK